MYHREEYFMVKFVVERQISFVEGKKAEEAGCRRDESGWGDRGWSKSKQSHPISSTSPEGGGRGGQGGAVEIFE